MKFLCFDSQMFIHRKTLSIINDSCKDEVSLWHCLGQQYLVQAFLLTKRWINGLAHQCMTAAFPITLWVNAVWLFFQSEPLQSFKTSEGTNFRLIFQQSSREPEPIHFFSFKITHFVARSTVSLATSRLLMECICFCVCFRLLFSSFQRFSLFRSLVFFVRTSECIHEINKVINNLHRMVMYIMLRGRYQMNTVTVYLKSDDSWVVVSLRLPLCVFDYRTLSAFLSSVISLQLSPSVERTMSELWRFFRCQKTRECKCLDTPIEKEEKLLGLSWFCLVQYISSSSWELLCGIIFTKS